MSEPPLPGSSPKMPRRLSPEESARLSSKIRRLIEEGVKESQRTRHPDGRLKTPGEGGK